ncbi:MAG TPA: hypothetical protein VNF73_15665 [Candidatus Saccharimonadales bacterium]|nr:hypothetical protein [Candidatus Saccharimonadales bacterium]
MEIQLTVNAATEDPYFVALDRAENDEHNGNRVEWQIKQGSWLSGPCP